MTAKLAKTVVEGGKEVSKISNAGRVVAKAVATSSTDFAKKAGTAAVNASAEGNKASKKAFWNSQKSALIDTAKHAQDKFIDGEAAIRAADDGPAQARALRESLDDAYAEAKPVQRQKTLDEWCNVLAAADMGGSPQSPVVENHMGDSSNEGVLGINVKAGAPGSKPWITSAEIEGLKKGLRDELKQRPLKDMHITKNFSADLDGDTSNFGVTPKGDYRWKSISAAAGEWLKKHAKLRGVYDGQEALVDDLKDEKLTMLEG